jgi:TP901 family phage tail tape measure protein
LNGEGGKKEEMENIFAVQAFMTLADHITGPLRSVMRSMDLAGAKSLSLSQRLGRLAKGMLPVAAAAAVVAAALSGPVKAAMAFDAQMAEVGAVSRATASEMDMLRQAALRLGSETAWSARDVGRAQQYLAMAGFTARENVEALSGVLNLASAASTDLGRAADIASDILSGFKLPAEDMTRVADVLTQTVTTANTNLEMLGDTMKYVGPVASSAGVSLEEAAAMAGLLANVGIKGSQAGTTLRAMLGRLAAPAGVASKALRELGVSSVDMEGNLRNPIAVLGEMAQAMEAKNYGSSRQLSVLKTIFGEEPMAGMAELLSQEGLGGITKYLSVIQDSAGAAEAVARGKLNNLQGSITLLKSAWEGLNIAVGDVFQASLRRVVDAAAAAVSWLGRLAQTPFGRAMIYAAGAASVLTIGLTALAGAAALVPVVLPFVIAGLASLGAAVGALFWPITLVIAFLGGLYLAWKNNLGGIRDIVTGWWRSVNLVFQGVREALSNVSDDVGIVRGDLAKDIKAEGLTGLVSTVARVVFRIKEMFAGFREAMKVGAGTAWNIIKEPLGFVLEAFKPMGQAIGEVAAALLGVTSSIKVDTWRALGEVVGFFLAAAFQALAQVIRFVLVAAVYPIIKAVTEVIQAVVWLGKAIGDAAGFWVTQWEKISNAVKAFDPAAFIGGAAGRLSGVLEGAVTALSAWLNTTINQAVAGIGSLITGAQSLLTGIDPIGWVQGGFIAFVSWIGGIRNAVLSGVRSVVDGVTSLFKSLDIITAVEFAFNAALNWLSRFSLTGEAIRIMGTLAVGIIQSGPALVDAVKASVAAALDYLASIDLSSVGRKVLTTMGDGIKGAAGFLKNKTIEGLSAINPLKAHSDADEGPLSDLTATGRALIGTIAEGVTQDAARLRQATAEALMGHKSQVAGLRQEIGSADFAGSSWLVARSKMEEMGHKSQVAGLRQEIGSADFAGSSWLVARSKMEERSRVEGLKQELSGLQPAAYGLDPALPEPLALPPVMGKAGYDVASPDVPRMPDAVGRGVIGLDYPELSALGMPVLPDLAAKASWLTDVPEPPELMDLSGRLSMGINFSPANDPGAEEAFIVPPPRIDQGEHREARERASDFRRRQSAGEAGRKITIQNLTVNLPNVKDADSFGEQLQRFVEQYDV